MSELISVLVAVYNTEKYIDRCIISIINQSYENIEIILVDDGSKDNSLNVCKKYQKKDSRIIIESKPNGGLATARNAGLKIATGKYICFVDSDDYLETDYIKKQYEAIIKENADVCVSAYYKGISRSEVIIEKYSGETVLDRESALKNIYLYNSFGAYSWNKMFCRNIITEHNILFDEELLMTQDLLWTTRYFLKIKKAIYVDIPLYHYEYTNTSISKNSKLKKKFNEKFLTSLLAHKKTNEILLNESGDIKECFDCRYVNTYMRLIVNLAYGGFPDKVLLNEARINIRLRLSTYLKKDVYGPVQKIGAILAAFSPKLFGYLYMWRISG